MCLNCSNKRTLGAVKHAARRKQQRHRVAKAKEEYKEVLHICDSIIRKDKSQRQQLAVKRQQLAVCDRIIRKADTQLDSYLGPPRIMTKAMRVELKSLVEKHSRAHDDYIDSGVWLDTPPSTPPYIATLETNP